MNLRIFLCFLYTEINRNFKLSKIFNFIEKNIKKYLQKKIGWDSIARGEMAEWSIAAVLKTVEGQPSQGSNPCLSAKRPQSNLYIFHNHSFYQHPYLKLIFTIKISKAYSSN
ncbi:hypothetical protein LLO_1292 [Legionella longbeachae NSW150]|uniref:Uncharacterized protein n=1 Tax=Legionella longbeachae serogroup 1 (strain NSW150) TaxID=661367 RepID=D3HRX2_LEGLN|nr:hypothetical protein LLO_1292 [Legionella longbeachae NSW150]